MCSSGWRVWRDLGGEELRQEGTLARRNLGSGGRRVGRRFRGGRGEWFLCLWETRGNRKKIGEDKSRYDLKNSTN